ncbi:hypothetical protein FDK21_18060 [Cohaesibacter sp. CAU 1516]|uniref:hypothetical protein n=1 Tax=Cohaesibacter sp. CAU 1516 TaxID=2576038 RepID=UPI0010FF20A5|nr:hypothetical protein [Cohaesibacter sp. CAU 1516]TLP43456.1 hypothetical protein FDK21_18060 [Cohaesibacter sp. CAU 1516]
MFRTSVRNLEFPDGVTRKIETYRLVWRWYDWALDYEFAPSQEWLLNTVLRCADHEGIPVDDALGTVLDYVIHRDEYLHGMDYTYDNLELLVAKQAMERYRSR